MHIKDLAHAATNAVVAIRLRVSESLSGVSTTVTTSDYAAGITSTCGGVHSTASASRSELPLIASPVIEVVHMAHSAQGSNSGS